MAALRRAPRVGASVTGLLLAISVPGIRQQFRVEMSRPVREGMALSMQFSAPQTGSLDPSPLVTTNTRTE